MAYFKKVLQKINGLWYPKSITMGEPIDTEKIIDRLSAISTVSKADVRAVLADLASVMADYMALGHTVKLDGLGTFYYTAVASKQGVATKEEVTADLITGVRVRFLPETRRKNGNRIATRALADVDITWNEVDDNGTPVTTPGTGESGTGGGTGEDDNFQLG